MHILNKYYKKAIKNKIITLMIILLDLNLDLKRWHLRFLALKRSPTPVSDPCREKNSRWNLMFYTDDKSPFFVDSTKTAFYSPFRDQLYAWVYVHISLTWLARKKSFGSYWKKMYSGVVMLFEIIQTISLVLDSLDKK